MAAEQEGIQSDLFRRAMGRFATGVTVITALDAAGRLQGLTANAFSSLSLAPPLLLFCLAREARCLAAIEQSRRFAVHILRDDQEETARAFARKGGDREGLCGWRRTERGVPLLADCLLAFECDLEAVHPGGDHLIVTGRVQAIHEGAARGAPLLYYGGRLLPAGFGSAVG